MAVCHGPNSPYGCGHHREHVRAAKKGWLTRRRGHRFMQSRDAAALKRSVGPLENLHTHRTKTGAKRYLFKISGSWFSVKPDEYHRLVKAGRQSISAERRAERNKPRDEARYRAYQERTARAVERAELREVRDIIKKAGGIKPSFDQNGKMRDAGEYRMLPSSLRRRSGRLTTDDAATEVQQHVPWLHIEGPDELVQYFERVEDRRHNRRAA